MKGECTGCGVRRELTGYDMSHTGQQRAMHLCPSCADTLGLVDLMRDPQGKLLLKINSKLDLLLARRKK